MMPVMSMTHIMTAPTIHVLTAARRGMHARAVGQRDNAVALLYTFGHQHLPRARANRPAFDFKTVAHFWKQTILFEKI